VQILAACRQKVEWNIKPIRVHVGMPGLLAIQRRLAKCTTREMLLNLFLLHEI
jgi:hypothetical protein